MFWGFAVTMLVVATLPLLRHAQTRTSSRKPTSTKDLYQQRLAELEEDAAITALDPAELSAAREDLARNLLAETKPATARSYTRDEKIGLGVRVLLVLLVSSVSVASYWRFGTPELATTQTAAPTSMAAAIAALEQRVAHTPEDHQSRAMLAQAYAASGDYAKAATTWEAVLDIVGEVPAALLQYADALAMNNDGSLSGRPRELVMRVLAIDPDNIDALALAGLAAAEADEGDEALTLLGRARDLSVASDRPIAALEQVIARLTPTAETNAEGMELVQVRVDLAPELRAGVKHGAVLYVIARDVDRPAPLAVVRRALPTQWPTLFTLSDRDSMQASQVLSAAERVDIVARIAIDGMPIAKSGDLEGQASAIKMGDIPSVDIVIDRVIP